MSVLVLLIVLTALGVGMYSLITGSSFAKPLIVLVLFEAGSFSMITSRHAPNIAPQSDENGVRGRVVNSPSPLARTADTATKGEVIAPRDGTGAVTKGQEPEAAAIAPLTIEGETGTNYLIKLVRVDGKNPILIFVRGGESYSTKVPLGTYNIQVAAGSTWYGRKDLFGPSTRFFRSPPGDGNDENFFFGRQGNIIHTSGPIQRF